MVKWFQYWKLKKTGEVIAGMNLNNYVSPARAAQIRGVSLARIIAMIKAGQLTPIPYDGGYVLRRSEVEGYKKKKAGRPSQNDRNKSAK